MVYNECIVCEDDVEPENWNRGYRACLCCREKKAQQIAMKRRQQVAPAYNKGSYQFITSKQMCRDLGK